MPRVNSAAASPVLFAVLACISATFISLALSCRSDILTPTIRGPTPLTSTTAAPIIRTTLGYITLCFAFVTFQSWTKLKTHAMLKKEAKKEAKKGAATESFNSIKYNLSSKSHKLCLTGDRTVGNLLEQSIPFLLSLWLHATYVDVGTASRLGWLWLFSRAAYPFAFHLGMPYLFISTVPGYAAIMALVGPVAFKFVPELRMVHKLVTEGEL